jgi:RHS repeat-associated protein
MVPEVMASLRLSLVFASVCAAGVAAAQPVESIDAVPPAIVPMPARPFVGAAQHRIPLTVPPFRGLEPALAISYGSSAGNGWLGVGMTLEGLSTIERVSDTLGAPRGDATDLFLLDGERLLPCAVGSAAPSCTSGGTHTTRRETFVRIALAGTTWTVTSPLGVVSTYQTLAPPVAVVTSRRDPSGNTVTYTYAVAGGVAYPATIAYNGTVISFLRAARTDVVTAGVGASLRRLDQRLIGIAIHTGGVLDRAYGLGYGATGGAGLSLLTAVREHGGDATVTAAGVSGGTALPPTQLAYNADPPAFTSAWYSGEIVVPIGVRILYDDVFIADVDGDGRGDAIAVSAESTGGTSVNGQLDVLVRRGRADGTFEASSVRTTSTANRYVGWHDYVRVGDVNGDNRADLVLVRAETTYGTSPTGLVEVQLALGTATGQFSVLSPVRLSSETYSGEYHDVMLADVDGDGRRDLVLVRLDHRGNGAYGSPTALVALSTGASFGAMTKRTLVSLADGTTWGSMRVHAGDVDGDGKDDLVIVQRGAALCSTGGSPDRAWARTMRSTGGGAFAAAITTTLTTSCADSYTGDALVDLNADGRADLVGDYAATVLGGCSDCDSDLKLVANLGRGDGRFETAVETTAWTGSGVSIGRFTGVFADVNGDGLGDRVGLRTNSGDLYVHVTYGRGDGRFLTGSPVLAGTTAPTWWSSTGQMMVGDVDGDGRFTPVASFSDNDEWHLITSLPSTRFGAKLASATYPTGGRVELTYVPSTAYPNGYLPFAFPVLASSRVLDGRGAVATTGYSYTGGLYSHAERRFFGFATARMVQPDGAIRDLAYTQHVADPDGALASEHERRSDGALLRYTTTSYARSGNGTTAPLGSLPARRYQYECNGDLVCKSRSVGWAYSAYGAVTREIDHGDDASTNDDRTTVHTQVVNPTAFITHLDSTVDVVFGAWPTGDVLGAPITRTQLAYDGAATHTVAPTRGHLTSLGRWTSGSSFLVQRWTYDAMGNPLTATTPAGRTMAMTYDARGQLLTRTNALGHVETRRYDALGRTTELVDPNGGTTRLTYDPLGRLVQRATPDGGVASASFTSWGAPTAQYVTTTIADGTADGLWTRTYVDGLGRTVRVLAEGGITTDTSYDGLGRVVQQSAPYLTGAAPAWTTTSYDAIGRVVRVQRPDGAAETTSYGDWTQTVTDPRGQVTITTYDGYQQEVQVIERGATDQVTTIARDLLGQVYKVIDAAGNYYGTSYDAVGRRVASNDPNLGGRTYFYDGDGRLLRQTDARGVTIAVEYDAIGRPTARRLGVTTTLATFTYDQPTAGYANRGRLTSFTDATGSTRRDYDAVGRLRSEDKTIAGVTYQLDWTYDQAGRVAAIDYPAVGGVRERVGFTYDAAGRPVTVGGYVTAASYDARGSLTGAVFGNTATLARSYSPSRGWVLGQSVTHAGVVVDHWTVTRDQVGNVTARTSAVDPLDAWQYGYDALGRLTSADNTADNTLDQVFTYGLMGNRTSARRGAVTTSYQYPATAAARPYAPSAIDGVAVRYDANGNRLGIGAAPDAVYDSENRLVSDGTTSYAYDAEGTRVRAGSTIFVRDLLEVTGATSWRYYHLGRERVARRDQAGTVSYYHGDQVGTVRRLINNAGAVVATRRFGPFGELLASTGQADPFGLAGERRDPSGLYRMGARSMDPVHGLFTSPDPSDDPDPRRPQTLNRYAYAYNNPARVIDPTGFQGEGVDPAEPEAPAPEEDDPYRPRILRSTPEGLRWSHGFTFGGRPVVYEAPRLYSRSFYDQVERDGAINSRWAFESQTGRLFASENTFTHGRAFETLDDARAYIDSQRAAAGDPTSPVTNRAYRPRVDERLDLSGPQYLESSDGQLYRYLDGGPGRAGTLEVIDPSEVPPSVGIDQMLFIFRQELLS